MRVRWCTNRVKKYVLSDKEAFYMQTLLGAGMTDAGGTSQALASQNYIGQWFWNKRIDAGGKTGTSNSHADAWFVGVTPNLVGGAWVGGEYRQIHFRSGALGQGSKTALPIFGLFMKKVLSDAALAPKYLARYRIPEGVNPADLEGRFLYQHADSTSHDSTAVDFSEDLGASPEEHGDNPPPPPAAPPHEPAAPKEPVNNTSNGTAEPVKDQGAKTGMNKNSATIKTDRTQSSGEKKPKKKASGDDLFN